MGEDVMHALWYRKATRKVWKLTEFATLLNNLPMLFADLLNSVWQSTKKNEVCLFGYLTQAIQHNRNETMHGKKARDGVRTHNGMDLYVVN